MEDQKKHTKESTGHSKNSSGNYGNTLNVEFVTDPHHRKTSSSGTNNFKKESFIANRNDLDHIKNSSFYNMNDVKHNINNTYNIKEDIRHKIIEREPSSYSVKDGKKHDIFYKLKIYWQNVITAFHYVTNDNEKNPRYI